MATVLRATAIPSPARVETIKSSLIGKLGSSCSISFLILNLGFSHPIYFEKPDTIEFETPNNTTIIIKGTDKQEVGEVSAKIRSLRKPEPYKGKGIKYSDEHVRRKAGKTVGA